MGAVEWPCQYQMILERITQDDIKTTCNAPNNKPSKYLKQYMTKLKGKIGKIPPTQLEVLIPL